MKVARLILFIATFIGLTIFGLFGCQKDYGDQSDISPSSTEDSNLPHKNDVGNRTEIVSTEADVLLGSFDLTSINKVEHEVAGAVLSFPSQESFIETMEFLTNRGNILYDKFERHYNFTSLRSCQNKVLGTGNPEDSWLYEPELTTLLNSKGFVLISQDLFRMTEEEIYKVTNGEEILIEKRINQEENVSFRSNCIINQDPDGAGELPCSNGMNSRFITTNLYCTSTLGYKKFGFVTYHFLRNCSTGNYSDFIANSIGASVSYSYTNGNSGSNGINVNFFASNKSSYSKTIASGWSLCLNYASATHSAKKTGYNTLYAYANI